MSWPKMPRHMPAQGKRVETGPVQFGDDWPGVFIRGDDALAFSAYLEHLLIMVREGNPEIDPGVDLTCGLLDLLDSCYVEGSK